jgi:hypothetical protein
LDKRLIPFSFSNLSLAIFSPVRVEELWIVFIVQDIWPATWQI